MSQILWRVELRTSRAGLNRRISTLYCVAAAFAMAGCQRAATPSQRSAFDAGSVFVEDRQSLSHTFEVVNGLGRPLQILDESHGCGCTNVELGRKDIPAHEKTTLTINVDVSHKFGEHTFTSTLKTDDPAAPMRQYRLIVRAYSRARINPEMVDLGTIVLSGRGNRAGSAQATPQASKSVDISVYSPAGTQHLPTPVISNAHPELAAAIGPRSACEILADGVIRQQFPINVTVHSTDGAKEENVRRDLKIDLGKTHSTTLHVAWRNEGVIAAVPRNLHFGSIDPSAGQTRSLSVRLRSRKERPFRILNVRFDEASRTSDRGAPIELPTRSQPSHSLALTLPNNILASGGRGMSGKFHVLTDDPECPEVEIPWSVFIKKKS
jgi:hypothetical protein